MKYEIICSICGEKEKLKTDKKYIDLTVYCKCSNCGSEFIGNFEDKIKTLYKSAGSINIKGELK